MKLLSLIFLLVSLPLFGQYIPLKRVNPGEVKRLEPFVLIESDSAYYTYFDGKKKKELPEINFEKEILIGTSIFVDCKAQMYYSVYSNPDSLTYTFYTRSCDGGCAGMTRKGGWFVCKKPPANYEVRPSPYVRRRDDLSFQRRKNVRASLEDWERIDFPCFAIYFNSLVSDSVYDALDLDQSLEEYLIEYKELQMEGEWRLMEANGKDIGSREYVRIYFESGMNNSFGKLDKKTDKQQLAGVFTIEFQGQRAILHCNGKTIWKSESAHFNVGDDQLEVFPIVEENSADTSGNPYYIFRRIR